MLDTLNQFAFNCFQSFVLGIIQGFTEFLPISSTAHLKIIPYFIGWSDPGVSISASLQLGSALAIVFYFRKDLRTVADSCSYFFKYSKSYNNNKLATYIFISSIPILVCGLIIKLFWSDFSNSVFRGLLSISIVSILMALLLAFSEIYGIKKKTFEDINIIDIIFIGISQSLAIIPGVSRSGITLTSSMLLGIERQTSARISFLIGIPAISISGLVEFYLLCRSSTSLDIIPTLIGIITSFISSIIAIDFFLSFLRQNNLFCFVYYRLAFGIFILINL